MQPGSRQQAEWLALSANQKHGLRRSRADKQRAIRQALRHPSGASLSDREIARHCGVDHKTVGRIRGDLEASGEIPRITERAVTRDGVTYRQDTGKLNNFAPVEQLVEALHTALTQETGDLLTRINRLTAIKRGDPQGTRRLETLSRHLPTPHRPRDLQAACSDLLTQLRGKIHTDYENICPDCRGAVYYFASVRLELRPQRLLRQRGVIVGRRVRATIAKSKVAPPHRSADLDIWHEATLGR